MRREGGIAPGPHGQEPGQPLSTTEHSLWGKYQILWQFFDDDGHNQDDDVLTSITLYVVTSQAVAAHVMLLLNDTMGEL